jgi:CheY-like chemotaxis protein
LAERLILIVDDDPDIAEAMGLVLESTGAEVRIEEDVDAGIAVALEMRPDLILVDLMLPDPDDGYFFVHRLRSEGEYGARVPVVLLSSLTRAEMDDLRYPEVEGAPFEAGEPVPISAFLEKPTPPARLLGAANNLLG